MATTDRNAFIESCTLIDYFQAKLVEWENAIPANASETFSISVIVLEPHMTEAIALVQEALVFPPCGYFVDAHHPGYHRAVLIDIPAVHPDMLPLGPNEVLCYILRELKLEFQSQSQGQVTDEAAGQVEDNNDLDSWQVYCRKMGIYREKRLMLLETKENIKKMKIDEKVDKIKSDIQDQHLKGGAHQQQLLQQELQQKKDVDQLDLDLLFHLLLQSTSAAAVCQQDQVKDEGMNKLLEWNDKVIAKIAKKLNVTIVKCPRGRPQKVVEG